MLLTDRVIKNLYFYLLKTELTSLYRILSNEESNEKSTYISILYMSEMWFVIQYR